jgi:hypothetical protein
MKYPTGTKLRHKIAGFEIIVEKDSGTRVTAFALFSNGTVDTYSCKYQKSEFVEVKE